MKTLLTAAIVSVGVLAACSAQAEDIHWNRDADAAWSATNDSGRPLLLFVTRPGCGYCTQMKAKTFRNPTVVQQINSSFIPLTVDAGVDPKFASELGVRSYPTLLVVSPRTGLLDEIKGYVPPEKLQQRLASHESRTGTRRAATPSSTSTAGAKSDIPAPPVPPPPPHLEGESTGGWKPKAR